MSQVQRVGENYFQQMICDSLPLFAYYTGAPENRLKIGFEGISLCSAVAVSGLAVLDGEVPRPS